VIEPRSGVWWTDSDPVKRIPGTLIREGDHWQLSLIGTLPIDKSWPDGLSLDPPTTIFGSCRGIKYTLHISYLVDGHEPSSWDENIEGTDGYADGRFWQHWHGDQLLQGGTLHNDALFMNARFELTGLGEWWPFRGLGNGPSLDIADYKAPDPTIVECDGGLVLTIGTATSNNDGIRVRSISERVVVDVSATSGFSLDGLMNDFIIPLRCLLAIAFRRQVEYRNLCVHQHVDIHQAIRERTFSLIEVEPGVADLPSQSEAWMFPTFTVKDIDASVFMPRWLRIAQDNPVPFAVAEPRAKGGSLRSQVVEAVNAAETLHRRLYDSTAVFPLADKVWEELKKTGLSHHERRKVRNSVKLSELPLELRLLQLANGIGEETCAWLLNRQVAEWAFVAATVRNALSHGYSTSHKVEEDEGALIGILRLAHVIVRLRLLVEAGFPANEPLIAMMAKAPDYRSLMKQSLADWGQLSATIKKSST
jgi:hypothetical protein